MEGLKLYRGITLSSDEADNVIEDTKTNGLDLSSSQTWSSFIWKEQLNSQAFLNKEDLSRTDTEVANRTVKTKTGTRREYLEGTKGICFADKSGAEYYALKHNKSDKKTVPILIEINVNLNSIAIDGRDFLYTAFSALRWAGIDKKKIEDALIKCFGNGISKFIEKTNRHPNSQTDAICDLAICDLEVKKYHSQNPFLIHGRHNTHFKSAFFVSTPLGPSHILSITKLKQQEYELPVPDVTLGDLLKKDT